jgi:hypothetical protein
MSDPARGTEIVMPRPVHATVVGHAMRKFAGHYLDGETPERKAFGVLAGYPTRSGITICAAFPLITNLRYEQGRREVMDEVVAAHAIPSQTPLEQRGWIADPRELLDIERVCDGTEWVAFGNYHTHRVPWPDDPLRDTCTELDRVLAAGSGQWIFILSMVDPRRPVLRAFFEGDNHREARIRTTAPSAPGAPQPFHRVPVAARS